MIIYLARHTAYDNPLNIAPFHLPVNLSLDGRSHAHRMGVWLKDNTPLSLPIVSSPIARCIQTSEIISSHTDSFVVFDERLAETSCPNLEGTIEPAVDGWKINQDDPTRETHESILNRSLSIYNDILAEGVDRILISHGDPLTLLLFHLTHVPAPHYLWSPEQEPKNIQRGEIVKLIIDNGILKDTERIKV